MKKFIEAKREYQPKRCDECNKMQHPEIKGKYMHPVIMVYIKRGNMRIRLCASCAEKFGERLKPDWPDPSAKKKRTKEKSNVEPQQNSGS